MIEIVPYRQTWPSEFAQIAWPLRGALGPLAVCIDHIGSTAVPDLAAKDVIDVQITVAALDERVVAAMTSLGYAPPEGVWRDHRPPGAVGPEADWEKLFFRPPPGQRADEHARPGAGAGQPAFRPAVPRLPARSPGQRGGLRRTQAPSGAAPGGPGDVP